MMHYDEILRALNVSLAISETPMECRGVYIPDAHTILVSPNLNDSERQAVIVHELGHLINGHEYNEWNAPSVQMRQEREANEAMADDLVNDYLASCETVPTYVDVDWFIESRGLSSELYMYIDILFRRLLA